MTSNAMHNLFALGADEWLERARHDARKLLKNRNSITIEDVLDICPKPEYLHKNTVGSVFNRDFVPIGFIKSKRLVSRGRWIRTWKLRDEE